MVVGSFARSLMLLLKKIFQLIRLSHWSKAIFVLLGVIYANSLDYCMHALFAALAFCLVASSVYIYNDLQDIDEDKQHPYKSQRPLAKGGVSISFALSILILCLSLGLMIGYVISYRLVVILCAYLFINLLYNHWFRNVPGLDVLCIASGFMLRILAGTIGIGLPITWWLTITATLLSLFIALCKRRLEMRLSIQNINRAVLRKYTPQILDVLIISTANASFVAYLLYTMYARADALYFVGTLPFCAIGLWRFTYLTTKNVKNDDPISLFWSDNWSCLNLLCFSSLTLLALFR